MPNANHGMRRPSSTSSDVKGGDNTSQRDEIMEIHSQVLEMMEIFKRMSAMLERIETRSKEQYDANLQASVREDRDVARTSRMSTMNGRRGNPIIGQSLLVHPLLWLLPDHVHLRIETNYSPVVLMGVGHMAISRWEFTIVPAFSHNCA
ncbi:hypothetical protein PAAG_11277 [Paracoccidioides lutzii Pb01]|uniref:Uncharacterized protein n=1 Tax=Paracoccidioides lutzii (strain ATCC MYA-826 / Pb01) TaxID=502779 RepID=A0A0A2V6B0_PARBA|nr:hypothetical protein PAAG_11277 [Paracoccidioides lutzii Pb01]KGQ01887.1 hypothetical protein PAAG_11277 [Paracoccidioides lutzii Pb01]